MICSNNLIAKRYACAFLNCYGERLTPDFFENLSEFTAFLKKNRLLYAYLSMTTLDEKTIDKIIFKIHGPHPAAHYTRKLLLLLLSQKKIILLDAVLEQIILQHRIQTGRMVFVVSCSSHMLEIEKQALEAHLKKITSPECTIKYVIDQTLIKGLRIQSSTLLWEHSVRKTIHALNHSLSQRMSS